MAEFTSEEPETPEVSQEEFDKTFLELLGQCTKQYFLDGIGLDSKLPTNRIDLRNSHNDWMFDIQYTGKNKHIYISYWRVWKIFEDKYQLQYADIERLMKNQMKILFGVDIVTSEKQIGYDDIEIQLLIG